MLFAFFAFVAWTQAQSVTVSGTVVGKDDGQPVIGANIVIKGTTTGTVSDVDGHFRLTAPRPGATLVISFVGYRTRSPPPPPCTSNWSRTLRSWARWRSS